MAAVLSATFKLIDQMSAKLDSISTAGESAMQKIEKTGTAAAAALGKSESAARAAEGSTKRHKTAIDDAAAALGKSESAARAAEGSTKRYKTTIDDATGATKKLGEESERTGDQTSDMLQSAASALLAAGVAQGLDAIRTAFGAVVGAAIQFESAITGVYKTVSGSQDQLARVSEEIREMSLVMPASAVQIAGVAEAAGQLGIATGDITSFTETMINLGEATNLSSEEAASTLAKFANITGMEAGSYDRLGSAIVALGNNFATTEADIAAMSLRLASAGTLAGLSEPQILALAASMSSLGIEADAGGSAMSKLLTDMQVAVETGSSRLEEFASVAGLTGEEFASAFGADAVSALQSFIAGLNDVERNGATATVILDDMGLTEVRLSNAVKSLANDSDGLAAAVDTASGAWAENAALSNEAGQRYGTLESRMSMTRNAATNLAAAMGERLAPAVGGVVDAGRAVLERLTGIVKASPVATAAIAGLTTAVTVAGVALTGIALVNLPMVKGAVDALTASIAANPLGLIVTGVVAVTAATVAFAAVMRRESSEYERWTATARAQHDELESLNAQYDAAVEKHGALSSEASALRYESDRLSESFEAGKRTLEEFCAQNDALIAAGEERATQHREAVEGIRNEELSALALVGRLDELSKKTSLTTGEQEQMRYVTDALNDAVPELALNYDALAASLGEAGSAAAASIEELRKKVSASAEEGLYSEQIAEWERLLADEIKMEEALKKAGVEYENQVAEMDRKLTAPDGRRLIGATADPSGVFAAAAAYNELGDALSQTRESLASMELSMAARVEAEAEEAARALTGAQAEAAKKAERDLLAATETVENGHMSAINAAKLYGVEIEALEAKMEEGAVHSENLAEAALAVEAGALSADDALSVYGLTLDELNGEMSRNAETGEAMRGALADIGAGFMTAETAAARYGLDVKAVTEAQKENERYATRLAEAVEAVGNGAATAAEATDAYNVSLHDIYRGIAANGLDETVTNATEAVGSLVEAYEGAYDGAYGSLNGQIGLFDDMTQAVSDYARENRKSLDPQNMIDALNSQAEYLAEYEANLKKANELDVNDGLLSQLSDGSVDSAAKLSALAEMAPEKIEELNAAFEKVQDGKDAFSKAVAEMETQFTPTMDKLTETIEDAVGGMDLQDEARRNAEKTVRGFIDGVDSELSAVREKMAEFSAAAEFSVVPVLSEPPTGGPSTARVANVTLPGKAGGTLDAPDIFVAGEKGPEIIVDAGGSAVFPADLSAGILSALNAARSPLYVDPGESGARRPGPAGTARESGFGASGPDKRIAIDINGSGEISVDGVDEETVWGYVEPKLKSAIMGLLRLEILTEGARSYAF